MTFPSLSFNAKLNSSALSALPVNVFVPLNWIFPLASYVFANAISSLSVVVTALNVPSPLSVTSTVMFLIVSSYVIPPNDPLTSLIV